MKIKRNRNGEARVVLERRDFRIGNFVITDEGGHLKFQSLGGEASYRVDCTTVGGRLRKELFDLAVDGDENAQKVLGAWNATIMNCLAVPMVHPVQDDGFSCMGEVNKVLERTLVINSNLYGVKEDISKKDDNAILKEEKEDYENQRKEEDEAL